MPSTDEFEYEQDRPTYAELLLDKKSNKGSKRDARESVMSINNHLPKPNDIEDAESEVSS